MMEEFLRAEPASKPAGALVYDKGSHRTGQEEADPERESAEFAELMQPRRKSALAGVQVQGSGAGEGGGQNLTLQSDKQPGVNPAPTGAGSAKTDIDSPADAGTHPVAEKDAAGIAMPARDASSTFVEARFTFQASKTPQRNGAMDGRQELSSIPSKTETKQTIQQLQPVGQATEPGQGPTISQVGRDSQIRLPEATIPPGTESTSGHTPLPTNRSPLSNTALLKQFETVPRAETQVDTVRVQNNAAPPSSGLAPSEFRNAAYSEMPPEQMRPKEDAPIPFIDDKEERPAATQGMRDRGQNDMIRNAGLSAVAVNIEAPKPTPPAQPFQETTALQTKSDIPVAEPRLVAANVTPSGAIPKSLNGGAEAGKTRAAEARRPIELPLQAAERTSSEVAAVDVVKVAATGGAQVSASATAPVRNAIASAIPNFAAMDQDLSKIGGDADMEIALTALDSDRANSKSLTQLHLAQAAKSAEPNARAVVAQIREFAISSDQRVTEIQLNPEELGRVRLTFGGGEVAQLLSIQVDRPETLDLIKRNLELLRQELSEAGYDMSDVSLTAEGQSWGSQEETEHSERVVQFGSDPFDQDENSPQTTSIRSAVLVDGRLDLRF